MRTHDVPIRYRNNPPLWGLSPNLGPKVQDEVTGFMTYECYIVTNDYGERVDCRGSGMYFREDRGNIRNGS